MDKQQLSIYALLGAVIAFLLFTTTHYYRAYHNDHTSAKIQGRNEMFIEIGYHLDEATEQACHTCDYLKNITLPDTPTPVGYGEEHFIENYISEDNLIEVN